MNKTQINLPKTSFSMKANLPTREPEILEFWKKINLYNVPKFPISGNDIKALGHKQSQEVGYIKKKVENWWLENGLSFSKQQCIDYLKKLPTSKRR